MKISIIIPTLNEAEKIGNLVHELRLRGTGAIGEIIVVDGGSTDDTVVKAEEAGARVLESDKKGRAIQMNLGAEHARYSLLYFLHADSTPPAHFDRKIIRFCKNGYRAGCFRLAFDRDHPMLGFYGWCTRFDVNAFRFGDQSLFVTKQLFEKIGGYDSSLSVMEDNEIVRCIKKEYSFKIIPDTVVTSARKYRMNGVIRLQLIFILIYVLFFFGLSQERLVSTYNKLVSEERPDNS